jgi:hypothetical protein
MTRRVLFSFSALIALLQSPVWRPAQDGACLWREAICIEWTIDNNHLENV